MIELKGFSEKITIDLEDALEEFINDNASDIIIDTIESNYVESTNLDEDKYINVLYSNGVTMTVDICKLFTDCPDWIDHEEEANEEIRKIDILMSYITERREHLVKMAKSIKYNKEIGLIK